MIQEMIAILQEDLPYIVLTEDPYLEAYNSDAVANVAAALPGRDRHSLLPAGLLRAAADARAGRGLDRGRVHRRCPAGWSRSAR